MTKAMTKLWTPMVKWKVSAETVGMLTLPPHRDVLHLGEVEIRLKDEAAASTQTEPVVVALRNATPRSPDGVAPGVRLLASVVVETKTEADARTLGYTQIEQAFDLLMLASGGQIAPSWVTDALQVAPESLRQRFVIAARANITRRVVWDERCDELWPQLAESLARLSEEDARHLRDAIRWWRRGCMETEPHIHFLFLWFALEALSGMSFVTVQPKKPRCKGCGAELTCPCGADQTEPNKVTASDMLVGTLGLWSKKQYKELYGLRCRVAHGNTGISPAEEETISETIFPLHQTVQGIIHGIIRNELSIGRLASV
jgi:hypothetical protein